MRRPLASALIRPALIAATLTAPDVHSQNLRVDTEAVSLTAGTRQRMTLSGAGISFDPRMFIVLGSTSGTSPGTQAGSLLLPLNFDGYLGSTLGAQNSPLLPMATGPVGIGGTANATFQFPLNFPALYGFELDHAMLIVNADGTFDVSNAVPVTLAEQVLRIETPARPGPSASAALLVRGRIGTTLSGTPGVRVDVSGTPAQLTSDPVTGEQIFEATLTLNSANTFVNVMATNTAGHREFATLGGPITFAPPDPNNIVLENGVAYLAMGSNGLGAFDPATGATTTTSVPGTVDDVCVADGFLFVLDAAGSGALRVFDLSNPMAPTQVSGPVTVPVSPFAGVSAAGGRVVVSGGTSLMTVRSYNATTGALGGAVASIDLGIGQPDVLLSADGSQALVSTDFAGSFNGSGFGITIANLNNPPASPAIASRVGLAGAGFSPGGAGPANFPIESALLPGNLFVTAHGGGLTLINRTTGANLVTVNLGFAAVNVDTDGTTAFAVGNGRLAQVDFRAPTSPVVVRNESLGTSATTGVAADANFVVVAANGGGVRVIAR